MRTTEVQYAKDPLEPIRDLVSELIDEGANEEEILELKSHLSLHSRMMLKLIYGDVFKPRKAQEKFTDLNGDNGEIRRIVLSFALDSAGPQSAWKGLHEGWTGVRWVTNRKLTNFERMMMGASGACSAVGYITSLATPIYAIQTGQILDWSEVALYGTITLAAVPTTGALSYIPLAFGTLHDQKRLAQALGNTYKKNFPKGLRLAFSSVRWALSSVMKA